MMKVFINGAQADTDARTNVSLTYSIATLAQFEYSKTGYSKTIILPMTARNMDIMGDGEQINAVAGFNRELHSARIERDGATVMEGTPLLMQCVLEGNSGFYKICIIGPGKQWIAHAAQTYLRHAGLDFSGTFGAAMIRDSWTWDKPVRFLPVEREGFKPVNVDRNIFAPQKVLSHGDYHPFLHVGSIIRKVCADAGFTIESRFMESLMFDSLYMSGNYPSKDTELLRSRYDFKAGRTSEEEAEADSLGMVYASPYRSNNSIGNIVQTADPNDPEGAPASVFSTGGWFGMQDSHVRFAPPASVVVGFEYTFAYTTDYKLTAPGVVKAFDTVFLGDAATHAFELIFPFHDRKEQLRGNKEFKVMVFSPSAGSSYYVRYWEVTNEHADLNDLKTGDYTIQNSPTTTAPFFSLTFDTTNRVVNPVLYEKKAGLPNYQASSKEWAMYDGHVAQEGTMDVEVTLRTAPETVSPSNPKTFHDIVFAGAEAGMKLKIGKNTTVRPVFTYSPADGETVDFGKVAAQNITCLELINSVRQMFNLYFFTDEAQKKIYIEPRKEFYQAAPVIDVSDRMDLSKPIVIKELGESTYRNITLCYRAGDRAVAQFDRENDGRLGEWNVEIESVFAKEGTKKYENAVFAPTVNASGSFSPAASASLMQVKEEELAEGAKSENANFQPRIVRYLGVKPLPAGQTWGWPGNGSSYPMAAFHYAGDSNGYTGDQANPMSNFAQDVRTLWDNGFSLCFEDRDGVAGLHRYWDGNVGMFNQSKRLEAYVMLEPEDIEPLVSPDETKRDFRALYRLTVGGESALFRLEEVCDYDPAKDRSTKCVFIKEV